MKIELYHAESVFPILNLEAHVTGKAWQYTSVGDGWSSGDKQMEHSTPSYVFISGGEGNEIPSYQPRGSLFSMSVFSGTDTVITLNCSGLCIANEDTPHWPRKLCSHIFFDVSLGYEGRLQPHMEYCMEIDFSVTSAVLHNIV